MEFMIQRSGFGVYELEEGHGQRPRVRREGQRRSLQEVFCPGRARRLPSLVCDYRHRSKSSYSATMTGMQSTELPRGSFLPRSCYEITITRIQVLSQIKWLLFNDCHRLISSRAITATDQSAPIEMREAFFQEDFCAEGDVVQS